MEMTTAANRFIDGVDGGVPIDERCCGVFEVTIPRVGQVLEGFKTKIRAIR